MPQGAPDSEHEVERRATESVKTNKAALAEAYRKKFGNEISTDNAREIVSPEYASSREERTRLSGATQKPAGELSDHLYDEALRNPDPHKRPVVTEPERSGAEEPPAAQPPAPAPSTSAP